MCGKIPDNWLGLTNQADTHTFFSGPLRKAKVYSYEQFSLERNSAFWEKEIQNSEIPPLELIQFSLVIFLMQVYPGFCQYSHD